MTTVFSGFVAVDLKDLVAVWAFHHVDGRLFLLLLVPVHSPVSPAADLTTKALVPSHLRLLKLRTTKSTSPTIIHSLLQVHLELRAESADPHCLAVSTNVVT